MRVWRIGRTLMALGVLGLGFLALSQPARAQSAEETVLFLLTGETQAPKANGRFAIDTKGETTVFSAATPMAATPRWCSTPCGACSRWMPADIGYSG
ncbi:hypothetical protein ABLE93_25620 [Xanthobacter sp. KR7-65]|uniref:hypothetical protein n=1 Tax=Xanthobacter sp. KR7-65 TaxID=3156612 RepID=UPI0032B3DBE1